MAKKKAAKKSAKKVVKKKAAKKTKSAKVTKSAKKAKKGPIRAIIEKVEGVLETGVKRRQARRKKRRATIKHALGIE
ncbi:MAG TPA: hypothetical protein VGN12_03090 [Pirellulales bacterium]